jgi:hypothetical protein
MYQEGPSIDRDMSVPPFRKSLLPTKKWLAAVVTALGAFLASLITVGEFNQEMQLALLGVIVSAAVSYLIENDNSPGGYKDRGRRLVTVESARDGGDR